MTLQRGLPLVVLFLLSTSTVHRARAEESRAARDFDERILADLKALDAEAADRFSAANQAAKGDDYQRAEALYREVLARQPDYFHAKRRLCSTILREGRRDEALPLCRQAMEQVDSPENRAALISALVQPGGETPLPSRDVREAFDLAQRLIYDDRLYAELLPSVCEAAVAAENLILLETCSQRMERELPNEVITHYYAWLNAVNAGQYRRARVSLERARELGLSDEDYAGLQEATRHREPWISRNAALLTTLGAAWIGGLLLLLALGTILSRLALAAVFDGAAAATAESIGPGRTVRMLYRTVLWSSCVYYYVSLPIVLAVVLALAGGILYGLLTVGRIPVKLLAIVAAVALVTVWAVIKSLIVRRRDVDPGDRLDLSGHARLRAVLDEVAVQIGTRPVDNVYITPGTDLAVMERGGMLRQLRGATERCLILGAGVLEGMKLGPFKSILAHEYGHFSNRDTAGGGFALSVRKSIGTMAIQMALGGAAQWYNPAWIFLNVFNRIFLRISQGASRLQEVLADRWAAFAYGPAMFERGLRHVIERSIRFDLHANATLKEVIEQTKPLSNFYTFVPAERVPETAVVDAVSQAINARPSPYDSHPSPRMRFDLVHALTAAPSGNLSDADDEAWSLFADRGALELSMTERIRANVAVNHGVHIEARPPTLS